MTDVKQYQTVSIWWFPDSYTVRGCYRGASHLIAKCSDLQTAIDLAFATDRKQLAVALVPAKEELEAFAKKVADMLQRPFIEGGKA